jgi:hypothetical protein
VAIIIMRGDAQLVAVVAGLHERLQCHTVNVRHIVSTLPSSIYEAHTWLYSQHDDDDAEDGDETVTSAGEAESSGCLEFSLLTMWGSGSAVCFKLIPQQT